MVGKATLNTILRLHVGVQLCKDSQKSSRVNLQKSDVQPKPIQYSKHCIGRDVVKGGKKEFQSTRCSHMHEVTVSLRCSFDLASQGSEEDCGQQEDGSEEVNHGKGTCTP